MMRKTLTFALCVFCMVVLFAPGAIAQGFHIQLVQETTSTTFVYLPGQEGNPTAIAGYQFEANYLLDGIVVGTFSGEVMADEPPFNPTLSTITGSYTGTSSFPGLGTFEDSGRILTITTSASAVTGDVLVTFMGPWTNGTGIFADWIAVVAGSGQANLFAGTATPHMNVYFQSLP
jgi:hypothetical protein